MDIDNVLDHVGIGRYQLMNSLVFGIMISYATITSVLYIFTASDIKYRCEIPGCDALEPAARTYEPEWLRFTTPYRDDTGRPQKCQRYAMVGPKDTSVNGSREPLCVPSAFDRNVTETCLDGWVFESPENTIGTEFGLMCEENKWMLTMVGSVHNFGKFIGIPVWGIVSDKFGRKFTMVFGTVMAALTYIVQSFSTCYPMFLILELVCSIFFSGVFAATFILGMESVLPGKRVLFYMVLGCFGPVGGMTVPLIASQVKDWRLLLRLFNVPALLFLSYYWLTDESMRWLEMRGRHDEVIGVLEKIATMNKKPLADLPRAPPLKSKNSDAVEANAKPVSTNTSILKEVIRSPTIFWRMIRCSFTWIASTLVYYGLNISSADIAGNKYLNFSLVVMVEIPAALLGWVIMERMSRKMSLSCMFMVSAISCIVYNLTPDHLGLTVKMFLFMISKLSISIAFSIVYIQTVEIFPTTMRVTMLSLCSMIGRLGSMLAPQITLLSEYFGEYTVMLLMGTTAFTAAVITLTLPESKNVKLPDTIDDAERIDNCLPLTELNPN